VTNVNQDIYYWRVSQPNVNKLFVKQINILIMMSTNVAIVRQTVNPVRVVTSVIFVKLVIN